MEFTLKARISCLGRIAGVDTFSGPAEPLGTGLSGGHLPGMSGPQVAR